MVSEIVRPVGMIPLTGLRSNKTRTNPVTTCDTSTHELYYMFVTAPCVLRKSMIAGYLSW